MKPWNFGTISLRFLWERAIFVKKWLSKTLSRFTTLRSDTHNWFFKVTFSVKLLVLDEYFTKLHKNFSAESHDHREHIQNSENFAQGDGAKLRLDLRKFFSRYGMKVGAFYKKSTEWNFEKISQNTYLDPISLTKNFQEFLIHKSCEKS